MSGIEYLYGLKIQIMSWQEKAIKCLKNSLSPIPVELNEIDWKSDLSPKTDRLAQHLCAFANQKGGGFFVYGVNNDATMFSVTKANADTIIKKLGNIAMHNLSQSIQIQHDTIEYEGNVLLFIYIPEQTEKPVYPRGQTIYDSYHRSAGQSVKMSKEAVKFMISASHGISFESQIAMSDLSEKEVLELLDYKRFYERLDKNVPKSTDTILSTLIEYDFVLQGENSLDITNLGAILLANDITKFRHLKGKTVRILRYTGTSNLVLDKEHTFVCGYAAGFEEMVDYIMKNLPQQEIIKGAIRQNKTDYPRRTIREFFANSLVHQDFTVVGNQVMVEIFTDRVVMTNPGSPLNDVNRFIDLPPHSRNEEMAQSLLLLNICERRGSGVDRAIEALEEALMPPPKFTGGEFFTRVFIYGAQKLSAMSKQDKIRACYQHCCLLYEVNMEMTNQSVRKRFEIDKNNFPIASRIITDTIASGLIKMANPESQSRKYASYIPHYA
ncbi:MAG: putative DNA binding domain-containing protein [Dysgonamonadaceae bacterium]|nr:putative DNA binding domain-containing protein [Dysgonamonadaceae bacterium]